jgi:phospholipase C
MALTGTAKGRTNMPDDLTHKSDLAGYFQKDQDTIFDRLTEKGIHWKAYFHDIPQSWVLQHQRLPHNAARYFYFDEFFDDARGREDDFPQFCFIEPDFMGIVGNDDHPPHDVMKAQKLIADVYNAVRANPALWASTLLVVYYDEHGGFYDHVVPPAAVRPDGDHAEYAFDQLGVRVPALLISPWVGQRVESTQFDHTSLLKYLTERWDLRPLLSKRMEQANTIAVALRAESRDVDLLRIELTADELTPPDLEREEQAIDHDSTHDRALRKLRDDLVAELDEAAPRWYVPIARAIDCVKEAFAALAPTNYSTGGFTVSTAEPDKLATGDTSVKDDIARLLMAQKKRAVAVLTQHIGDENATDSRRRHAAETLSMISGRRFHEEDKLGEAKRLVQLRVR